MLIKYTHRTITNSSSPLAFKLPENPNGFSRNGHRVWDRFLAVDGDPIFNTGVVCSSCVCFFEKLDGNIDTNVETGKALSIELNQGIEELDDAILQKAERLIPDGDYIVMLSQVIPTLCQPGDETDYFSHENVSHWSVGEPIDPKTEYYRLRTNKFKKWSMLESLFVECLVPLHSSENLEVDRVAHYQDKFKLNDMSTVLALSIIDDKASEDPAEDDDPDIYSHQLLTHYIVDGHHKAYAAACANKPITLLSFLNIKAGFGEPLDEKAFLENLQKPDNYIPERDIMLKILCDKNEKIESRINIAKQFSDIKYKYSEKIDQALIEIASNKNEIEELIVSAADALTMIWSSYKTYLTEKEASSTMDSFNRQDLTPLAIETIKNNLDNFKQNFLKNTEATWIQFLLDDTEKKQNREIAAEQLAKSPTSATFDALYQFCCHCHKKDNNHWLIHCAAASLGKVMFRMDKTDFSLFNDLSEAALKDVIATVRCLILESAEEYVDFSDDLCDYIMQQQDCSQSLIQYAYQARLDNVKFCIRGVVDPKTFAIDALRFHKQLEQQPTTLDDWFDNLAIHIIAKSNLTKLIEICQKIQDNWVELVANHHASSAYPTNYIKSLVKAIILEKGITKKIKKLTNQLKNPGQNGRKKDAFFNLWHDIVDSLKIIYLQYQARNKPLMSNIREPFSFKDELKFILDRTVADLWRHKAIANQTTELKLINEFFEKIAGICIDYNYQYDLKVAMTVARDHITELVYCKDLISYHYHDINYSYSDIKDSLLCDSDDHHILDSACEILYNIQNFNAMFGFLGNIEANNIKNFVTSYAGEKYSYTLPTLVVVDDFFIDKKSAPKRNSQFIQKLNALVISIKTWESGSYLLDDIEKLMSNLFSLYRQYLQHHPKETLDNTTQYNKFINQHVIEQIRERYLLREGLYLSCPDEYDDSVWLRICQLRSNIETFNSLFGFIHRFDDHEINALLFNNLYRDLPSDRPANAPKHHWWWFC